MPEESGKQNVEDGGRTKDQPQNSEGSEEEGGGAPSTFELTVNGSRRKVTLDELKQLGQKGLAADERFQSAAKTREEAAQLKEEAENAIRFQRAFKKLEEDPNDYEAYRTVASAMGRTQKEIDEAWEQAQKEEGGGQPDGGGGKKPAQQTQPQNRQVRFEDLPREVQNHLRSEFEGRIEKEIKEAVAGDENLQYAIGRGETTESAVRRLVKDAVEKRCVVGLRGRDGVRRRMTYGPEVVKDAVQEIRQTVEDLGIRDSGDQPPGQKGPGVGRAPGGSATRQPPKKLKRVPVTDAGYDEWFQNRLRQLAEE